MRNVARLFDDEAPRFAKSNIEFYKKNTRELPQDFQHEMSLRYVRAYKEKSLKDANTILRNVSRNVSASGLALASDDDAIIQAGRAKSKDMTRIWSRYVSEYVHGDSGELVTPENMPAANVTELLSFMQTFCRNQGIQPPLADSARNVTESGCIRRLMCDRWWVRNLRKAQSRAVELAAIQVGLVSKYKSPYVSETSIKRRLGQKKRNASILSSMVAINEIGYERTLEELASVGVANPAVRFAEMMTRLKGMEEMANSRGKVCDFWTLTCPSKMHASSNKYNGTTPREAQQYLAKVWARFRAACKRRGVTLSGIRVAEPHQDACPHWHMLIWMNESDIKTVRKFMHKYARQMDGNESGAAKNRARVIGIDASKGSAVGYVIKYIAKNVDGGKQDAFFSKDENGDKVCHEAGKDDAIARVDAWASTWGIRQFQFIGADSVTLWRELRRIRANESETIKHDDIAADAVAQAAGQGLGVAMLNVTHGKGLDFSPYKTLQNIGGDMAKAWGFADVGDWSGYSKHAGALELLRVGQRGQLNAYNEPKAKQIMGVKACGTVLITRRHVWNVEKATKEQLEQSELRREAAEKAAFAAPWTCVNNCTQGKKQATTGLCLKSRHKTAHAPPIQ